MRRVQSTTQNKADVVNTNQNTQKERSEKGTLFLCVAAALCDSVVVPFSVVALCGGVRRVDLCNLSLCVNDGGLLLDRLETHIEALDGVGKRPNADEIDSTQGIVAQGVDGDTT